MYSMLRYVNIRDVLARILLPDVSFFLVVNISNEKLDYMSATKSNFQEMLMRM
jgi:hypothetical protein